MSRRLWAAPLLFAVTTVPAHAQLVVIDPGNLVQTVLIAQRAEQIYEQVQAQYRTIVRLGQSLGSLDRYQIPAIGITAHDPGRWIFGAPWLQGLNTGDARGTAYLATAVPLLRPDDRLSQLTPEACRDGQAVNDAFAAGTGDALRTWRQP